MRVAVTGDRDWGRDRYREVYAALSTLKHDDLVVLGDAHGVDALAREACQELGLPFRVHVADWGRLGRSAGPQRNKAMLDELRAGDAFESRELWWFHDDLERSRGTRNCVSQAKVAGVVTRRGTTITSSTGRERAARV